jgi:hypothetical protein
MSGEEVWNIQSDRLPLTDIFFEREYVRDLTPYIILPEFKTKELVNNFHNLTISHGKESALKGTVVANIVFNYFVPTWNHK